MREALVWRSSPPKVQSCLQQTPMTTRIAVCIRVRLFDSRPRGHQLHPQNRSLGDPKKPKVERRKVRFLLRVDLPFRTSNSPSCCRGLEERMKEGRRKRQEEEGRGQVSRDDAKPSGQRVWEREGGWHLLQSEAGLIRPSTPPGLNCISTQPYWKHLQWWHSASNDAVCCKWYCIEESEVELHKCPVFSVMWVGNRCISNLSFPFFQDHLPSSDTWTGLEQLL